MEETEPPSQTEECLPCEALDHLCQILPSEDGKKVCEEIKYGLQNDTMDEKTARDLLATKIGRHILAEKLTEVSLWIEDQVAKRDVAKTAAKEVIPLKEEPKEPEVEKLPPLPEEMTKPLEEITGTPEKEPPIAKDFVKHSPDDDLFDDLEESDYYDDPAYMYDDTDLFDDDELLQEGLYDDA